MMKEKALQGLRHRVYRLFLKGDGRNGAPENTLDLCRRAEIIALSGDFLRAFEVIKGLKKDKKKWLIRIISAFRRSLELPSEMQGLEGISDFGLLLRYEYFEAARMWAKVDERSLRFQQYFQIFQLTSLPEDVEMARQALRDRNYYGHRIALWLDIAEATGQIDDVHRVRNLLKSYLTKTKRQEPIVVIYLARFHSLDPTGRHLRKAVMLASKFREGDYRYKPGAIEAWEAIVAASGDKSHQESLAQAREDSIRFEQEWQERWEKRDGFRAPDLDNPADCIAIAEEEDGSNHLRKAIKLMETYNGSDRTLLLLALFDLIDRRRRRKVLPRRVGTLPQCQDGKVRRIT
ncbi:hypothetical protein KJ782_05250 [Patescibacteria group bacterium]|nr:hypothetical protein [Patescibacteria group bacterium]